MEPPLSKEIHKLEWFRGGCNGSREMKGGEERPTDERTGGAAGPELGARKYVVIINSKEPETVWNAFRFAATAASRGHKVSVFLMGPAVEIATIPSDRFDVPKILKRFLDLGGETLSCGTCLRLRHSEASAECPMSTMDTLVRLTEEADKTVTFG